MAYAIRVLRAKFLYSGRHRDGWISAFGYTTAENIKAARTFEARDDAESFALLLAAKLPYYIGKLEVVVVVASLDKRGNVIFTEECNGSVLC